MTMMIIVFKLYRDERSSLRKFCWKMKNLFKFSREFLPRKMRKTFKIFLFLIRRKVEKLKENSLKSSHNLSISRSIVALTRKLLFGKKNFEIFRLDSIEQQNNFPLLVLPTSPAIYSLPPQEKFVPSAVFLWSEKLIGNLFY